MQPIKALKLKIYQPSAHYRVPFSYQRRFTYPIPPFSTVKGLLCNLLGITDQNYGDFVEGLHIAVLGRYESLTKEYTWFRNLSKKSHIDRFHTVSNRIIDGTPQHIGGQMPVVVDVLNEVHLMFYVYHADKIWFEKIHSACLSPQNRTSVLHLGRAEDWIVFEEEPKNVELMPDFCLTLKYFTWLPEKEFLLLPSNQEIQSYETLFNRLNANVFRLPLHYEKLDGQRVFTDYLTVKLFEGGYLGEGCKFWYDSMDNLPIFLTRIKKNENSGKE